MRGQKGGVALTISVISGPVKAVGPAQNLSKGHASQRFHRGQAKEWVVC